MARGPNQGPGRGLKKSRAQFAEGEIDRRIANLRDDRLTIPATELGIDGSIWEEFLKQKYLDAGWTCAEWVHEQQYGDYLDLDMAEKR
jgi:hypothetical protein